MKVLTLSDLNFLSREEGSPEKREVVGTGGNPIRELEQGYRVTPFPVQLGQHDFVAGHVNGVIRSSPEHAESP